MKFAAKVASLVNPANIPFSSVSTTTGKNICAFGYASIYFATFLNQIDEYSSSNSNKDIQEPFEFLTP